MGKKSGKSKENPAWKEVKIDYSSIIHDNAIFEGFAGLEVLENYDNSLVKKHKLIYDDIQNLDNLGPKKKMKKEESEDESEPEIETPKKEPSKSLEPAKKKSKKAKNSYPGQFVLLKRPAEETSDDEEPPELVPIQSDLSAWQELGVPEPILKAIALKGFQTPTEIQSLTIPPAILGRRDILGAAETGSGKTLAFGIPIIDGILKLKEQLEDPAEKPLYALILTPTRELASQIHQHLRDIAQFTDLQIAAIFGGLAAIKQRRLLRQQPEIIIATPGRLWELLQEGDEHLEKIDSLRFLAVDETDRMIERGHFEELQKIVARLNANEEGAKQRQNFIFSATLTMVHDLPEHVLRKAGRERPLKPTPGQKLNQLVAAFGVRNPKIVDITTASGTARGLTECRILCRADQKDFYLYYFLQRHPGRTIVFCNSIEAVKRLVSLLAYLRCAPLGLHGGMEQRQRLRNIDRFKASATGLLVATDVAARGLDIPLVQHVIHFQVPRTTEAYVHRSGRTARASHEGVAILLVEPAEVRLYAKLQEDLGRTEDLPLFPTTERAMRAAGERVRLAREVEKIDLVVRREANEENWSQKAAKEADLDVEDSDKDSDVEEQRKVTKSKQKQVLRAKSMQLAQMLATPLFLDATKYPTSTENQPQNGLSAIAAVQQSVAEAKEFKKKKNKKRKRSI